MATTAAPLVEPDWIADRLDDESVCVIEVDVAPTSYREGHIPGARLWNIYADLRRPGYMPVGARELEQLLARSGVTTESTVVFYGYGAHLGYWLLASHGHRDVHLLDGPRERWLDTGSGWSLDEPDPSAARYVLGPPDPRLYATREAVLASIGDPQAVLLDVRSQAEYDGERFWPSGATEGAGRAGHLPGSVHLPIEELRTGDGRLRDPDEIRRAVRARGITDARPVITYCTVGNRASQAWYALAHLLGHPRTAVYHGSWAEWGSLADTPIEA